MDASSISTVEEGLGALALGFGAIALFSLIGFALFVFALVCQWKMFVKMGLPGWKAIIPVYNNYLVCKYAWGSGWMMLTWFIPVVGTFAMLATTWKWIAGFGKGFFFCLLSIIPLTAPICMAIVAFDSSTYELA